MSPFGTAECATPMHFMHLVLLNARTAPSYTGKMLHLHLCGYTLHEKHAPIQASYYGVSFLMTIINSQRLRPR